MFDEAEEQVNPNVIVPEFFKITVSLPEVSLLPDQEPFAEHDVALDDDQVRVTVAPVATEEEDALKFTTGAGLDGGVGVEPPPPPPPPPQLARINVETRI